VLSIRIRPEDFKLSPEKLSWTHEGIIAFSKICSHMGCAIALYEQQTKHLLCPCHQSTFDVLVVPRSFLDLQLAHFLN
jgi:ubiquinol-cytochrome c reductase iron-sulfur subunit